MNDLQFPYVAATLALSATAYFAAMTLLKLASTALAMHSAWLSYIL